MNVHQGYRAWLQILFVLLKWNIAGWLTLSIIILWFSYLISSRISSFIHNCVLLFDTNCFIRVILFITEVKLFIKWVQAHFFLDSKTEDHFEVIKRVSRDSTEYFLIERILMVLCRDLVYPLCTFHQQKIHKMVIKWSQYRWTLLQIGNSDCLAPNQN